VYETILDRPTADFLIRWGTSALARTPWRLAGGTGLALQIGHRRSADLDWFIYDSPVGRVEELDSLLPQVYESLVIDHRDARTLRGVVDGARASWFVVTGRWLGPPVTLAGFPGAALAGRRDLAAAKFVAIGQRGTRRDFVDLHVLLDDLGWDLAALVGAVREKFPGQDMNLVHYLKSLTYFAEAEAEPMPHMLRRLTWQQVRRAMEQRVRDFARQLEPS
jgi:hypothetical protein